eukprot:7622800-Pyramimonas_sp.AAC.1
MPLDSRRGAPTAPDDAISKGNDAKANPRTIGIHRSDRSSGKIQISAMLFTEALPFSRGKAATTRSEAGR